MPRRAADLVNVPTRKPEQVRNYGRFAEELLGDLMSEFICRRKELNRRVYALLKQAHKEGIGKGEDKWFRATRVTAGLLTASIGVRVARAGIRTVYPSLERYAGVEIDGLREKKYGKGYKRDKGDDERMDV